MVTDSQKWLRGTTWEHHRHMPRHHALITQQCNYKQLDAFIYNFKAAGGLAEAQPHSSTRPQGLFYLAYVVKHSN